jgi:hypothetical protein
MNKIEYCLNVARRSVASAKAFKELRDKAKMEYHIKKAEVYTGAAYKLVYGVTESIDFSRPR